MAERLRCGLHAGGAKASLCRPFREQADGCGRRTSGNPALAGYSYRMRLRPGKRPKGVARERRQDWSNARNDDGKA